MLVILTDMSSYADALREVGAGLGQGAGPRECGVWGEQLCASTLYACVGVCARMKVHTRILHGRAQARVFQVA